MMMMVKTIKYKDGDYCEIYNNGDKYWCNDKYEFHRTNGPAIEHNDGDIEWYLNNRWICSFDKNDNPIDEI
jgi:hypothetical protein